MRKKKKKIFIVENLGKENVELIGLYLKHFKMSGKPISILYVPNLQYC